MTTVARERRTPSWARGLFGFVVFLVMLEIVPLSGLVPSRYLPPLHEIGEALGAAVSEAEFWIAVGDTLGGWGLGLSIALGAGIVLGLLIGSSGLLLRFTASTIEFLRPIPSVALIPLAVLMFGTEIESKLMLIVYAAFWQVLIQVLYGVRDVDPVARDTARSFRFGAWSRIRHVVWPTALPYVMTGFRLAATVALVLAITAELVIGNPGLGKQIATARSSGAVETMYALVLVTGVIGVLVNVGVRLVERRVLAWHPSVRREVPA
ncbi:MAG: ABC transporter permease subunit [Propionibacteriales bacterium]|nr:ABC transporter permease subunit [Propionibacteriales bacterium]